MSKDIHHEEMFNCSPEKLYDIFMSPEMHGAFTGSPTEIDSEVGGAFSCHGGMLTGRNLELVPGKRIVQAWRIKDWPDGAYSVLRLELEAAGEQTRLVMDHTGVPDEKAEHLDAGWTKMYWNPLRSYLG